MSATTDLSGAQPTDESSTKLSNAPQTYRGTTDILWSVQVCQSDITGHALMTIKQIKS